MTDMLILATLFLGLIVWVKMTRTGNDRVFLDELPENTGRYQDEPEIQCGIFCEAARREIAA